jgi:hypothetical protein
MNFVDACAAACWETGPSEIANGSGEELRHFGGGEEDNGFGGPWVHKLVVCK